MSTKTKSIAVIAARVLLGLVYLIFGINFFVPFIPMQPQPEGAAGTYMSGLFAAGYFMPLVKIIEVVGGALLLTGFFVPLSVAFLLPISLHIFLFHIALVPEGAPVGIVVLALNLFLVWAYKANFKLIFQSKAPVSL